MASREAQCFTAYQYGEAGFHKPINDATVDAGARDPHAKATFAKMRASYDRVVSSENPWKAGQEEAAAAFETSTGVGLHDVAGFFRNPNAILGDELINRVEGLYLDHIQKYGGKNKAAWQQLYAPQIKALENQYMDRAPALYQDYASKYFKFQREGGQLYSRDDWGNPIAGLVRNAVGNLVHWNPVISMMNVFEFTPKALAYAIEVAGPTAGPAAVIKAIGQYAEKTGLNISKRLPEYEQLGIYGITDEARRLDLVSLTENPLRGLSAELGQVLGRTATEGVERVAFVNRFGNEVQAFWTKSGADTVTLMRFAIAANKFYLNLVGKAVSGDINSALALAAFTAATAAQTGGISSIPAPVAYVFKDSEAMQAIRDFDEETKLNISSQLGLDIAEKSQPLGGISLGVGYTIATQDVVGGLKNIAQAPGDLVEGKAGLATAKLVEGLLGAAQVARIPGVNLTTKRLAGAVTETLENDQDLNALWGNATNELGLTGN